MVTELIALRELQEEVEAMLRICFEGMICNLGNHLEVRLPNGQRFKVYLKDA